VRVFALPGMKIHAYARTGETQSPYGVGVLCHVWRVVRDMGSEMARQVLHWRVKARRLVL
jgi:hypothetical protein